GLGSSHAKAARMPKQRAKAAVGPVCCKAAKSVPKRCSLFSLRNFGPPERARPRPGQTADILCSADFGGSTRRLSTVETGHGWLAGAVRRSAAYRRLASLAGSAVSAGVKVFCSTCRCAGFFLIGKYQ